jgi:hypothetical protein
VANEFLWVGLPELIVVAIARLTRRSRAAELSASLRQN